MCCLLCFAIRKYLDHQSALASCMVASITDKDALKQAFALQHDGSCPTRFETYLVCSGHWCLLPQSMQEERQAGFEVDLLRHAEGEAEAEASADASASVEVEDEGPGKQVELEDEGPGRQTDQSIADAIVKGDEALLEGKGKGSHPRCGILCC